MVAVPTDTVYGLAASLDDEGAIAALFAFETGVRLGADARARPFPGAS